MKKRVFIILMTTFCLAVTVQIASAQNKKMKDDKMMMSEMEKSPHHKMMMAYRQNVTNFADALSGMAKDEKTFDANFARTAVAEIKRSAAMMDEIHRKHSAMMNAEMSAKMKPMMEKMSKNQTALNEHISALEKLLESEKPNLKEIETHAAAISAQFGEMKKPGMKM